MSQFADLIGLEADACREHLQKKGISDFKFVYYVDRKQKEYDKELVTAVRNRDGIVEVVVCRYKLDI